MFALLQPVGPPHQYQWRYVGGEVFNASVPANSHYADLCLKLNDTVGYTTSVKYQAPGEELVPDELVSITGEDDLQVRPCRRGCQGRPI